MSSTAVAMGHIVDMLAPLPTPDLTPDRLHRTMQAIRDMEPVGWLDATALLAELNRASGELVDATARADRLAVALGQTKVLLDDARTEVDRLTGELAPWRAVQQLRDAQLARSEMTR